MRGVSPTQELFPRRMARRGAGSARREWEVMPAGCCGCGDPPANPLGRRWLALRPCGAGSAPSGPGGSGSHRSRGSLGSPRDQLRACPAPPQPLKAGSGAQLRLSPGLLSPCPLGSAPHLSSGAAPDVMETPPPPAPAPPPGKAGTGSGSGSGRRRGGGSAGSSRWPARPSVERGGPAAGPARGCSLPAGASARPDRPCMLAIAPARLLPSSLLPAGAAARGPWRGRPASRRCGAQVGIRRRDAMGRDGTGWDELAGALRARRGSAGRGGAGRAGERQPANSAHEKSVALALSKRLSRPAGSEGAHGCRPGRGRQDRRLLPGQRLSRRAPPASSRRPRGLRPRCHSPTRLFRSDSQVRHLPCSGTVLLRGLFPCWCAPCGTEPERIPGEPGRTGQPLPRGWAGAALPAAAGSGGSPGSRLPVKSLELQKSWACLQSHRSLLNLWLSVLM